MSCTATPSLKASARSRHAHRWNTRNPESPTPRAKGSQQAPREQGAAESKPCDAISTADAAELTEAAVKYRLLRGYRPSKLHQQNGSGHRSRERKTIAVSCTAW